MNVRFEVDSPSITSFSHNMICTSSRLTRHLVSTHKGTHFLVNKRQIWVWLTLSLPQISFFLHNCTRASNIYLYYKYFHTWFFKFLCTKLKILISSLIWSKKFKNLWTEVLYFSIQNLHGFPDYQNGMEEVNIMWIWVCVYPVGRLST